MSCQKCPHCAEIRKAKSKAAVLAKPRPRKSEKQQARKEHALSTKEIRAAVMLRSGGQCESEYGTSDIRCDNRATDLDHWLGGSGRRKQRQSVETTWMLCATHHHNRTQNWPSVERWNNIFRAHCAKHGYPPPTLHVETPPLPSRFRRPHVEKSPGAP